MSLTKITNADLTGRGVIGQPDVPRLPAAEMQAKIEEIVRDVVIPNINDNIDELDNNFLKKTGDGANETVAFSEAESRANIATGETLAMLFGKIKKYFTDLKTIAFTGNFADLTSNAHKSQHATGGTDALTPADIGAQAALTLPLSISNGGTGAITAAAALAALGGLSMTKVWENASTGSVFNAQTISVDLSGYDLVMIICMTYMSDTPGTDITPPCIIPVGGSGNCYVIASHMRIRHADVTTTGVTFATAQQVESYGSSPTATQNARVLPYQIYGIKGVQ